MKRTEPCSLRRTKFYDGMCLQCGHYHSEGEPCCLECALDRAYRDGVAAAERAFSKAVRDAKLERVGGE